MKILLYASSIYQIILSLFFIISTIDHFNIISIIFSLFLLVAGILGINVAKRKQTEVSMLIVLNAIILLFFVIGIIFIRISHAFWGADTLKIVILVIMVLTIVSSSLNIILSALFTKQSIED